MLGISIFYTKHIYININITIFELFIDILSYRFVFTNVDNTIIPL